MSREFVVAWGGTKDSQREEHRVTSVDELDFVLDSIELSAMQYDCIYQVDLWLTHISSDDPILIQFLIGHSERSSLLWHEDGTTLIAVQEQVTPSSEGLRCERFGIPDYIDPGFTMISPAAVRDALSLFVLVNKRPDISRWKEAEQD
jgi:hypothetical protein